MLIPGYNEEKVIVRTIRSVLNSDYPNMRIVVIDDGSKDRTSEVARAAYPEEICRRHADDLAHPERWQSRSIELCRSRLAGRVFMWALTQTR